jgi:hypothetical protein
LAPEHLRLLRRRGIEMVILAGAGWETSRHLEGL